MKAFLLNSGMRVICSKPSSRFSTNLELNENISAGPRPAREDPIDALSAREYQVFTLLVDSYRPGEIARYLGISPKTVATYKTNLMRKLDICSVAGLVRLLFNVV